MMDDAASHSHSRYEPTPGADAALSAELASRGMLFADAPWPLAAAKRGDLMHPKLWESWVRGSDEAFERVVELLSEAELSKLRRHSDPTGGNWALAFYSSPGKLAALIGRGLDINDASCKRSELAVSAAELCCMAGWAGALYELMLAGAQAPERVPLSIKGGRHTLGAPALCALAGTAQMEGDLKRMRVVAMWLSAKGEGLRQRDMEGDDALKTAMRADKAEMAELLMDLGSRLDDKNARGQSAFEVYEEELERLADSGKSRPELPRLARRMSQERVKWEASEIKGATAEGLASGSKLRM